MARMPARFRTRKEVLTMEKEIGNVIEGLSGAFEKESDDKNGSWIRDIKAEYKHLDLTRPEHFSLLNSLAIKDKAHALLRTIPIFPADFTDRQKKHKVQFAFLHYSFIDRHLKSVICTVEGHGCSTDKTRWLIDSYVKQLLTGEEPVVTEKRYWHPKCGEPADWMAWIDTMPDLYYGQVEEYVHAKYKILKSYEAAAESKKQS
jgi:hypothetical protein